MRTLQEKQALVLEALQPGNSVAAVARKHGEAQRVALDRILAQLSPQ
jgi:transposase-like protein